MREKSVEKKNKILKATLELIAKQGFHGTSISQIADSAKVNVGSMYYYFKSKNDILNALYIDCKTRVTQCAFCGCFENSSADIQLKQLMVNIIQYFSENEKELSFIEQYENSPYISSIVVTEEYGNIMEPYVELYEQLTKQDLIKKLPLDIMQSLISGAVIALAKCCIGNGNILRKPLLTSAIDAIWDMVKK
jgi:AcrR family transcriptional regulator